MLTWAVNTRVGSLGCSRNTRTPAQHRVVVSSGVTATGCIVMLGGTVGERVGVRVRGKGAISHVGHTPIHTYTPHTIVRPHSQGTNTMPVNVSLDPMLFLATALTV